MPRSWNAEQISAEEKARQAIRTQTFQGTARIRLDNLSFGTGEQGYDIQRHLRNTERLRKDFVKKGCFRLPPSNHISAVIPADIFKHALLASKTSLAALRSPENGIPPELIFSSDYAVQCLDGRSRCRAAEQVLEPSNRWWTVDIYSDTDSCVAGAPERLYSTLKVCGIAKPESDGEVFWMIEQCRKAHEHYEETLQVISLSLHPRKLGNLKILDRNRPLATAFIEVLAFRGHRPGFILGDIHKMSDVLPEILRYLDRVRIFWSTVAPQKDWVDAGTVQLLECRAPQRSEKDRKWLTDKMESGELFPTVVEQPLRQDIVERIMQWDYLIPSINTFFQDFNYIILLKKILKRLLTVKKRLKHSLQEEFYNIFSLQHKTWVFILDDDGNATWVSGPQGSKDDQFYVHFIGLVLDIWRRWARLSKADPRMDNRGPYSGDTLVSFQGDMWPNLAQTAQRLGFTNDIIAELAQHQLATECNKVRPLRKFVVEEENMGVALDHRCGKPFESDVSRDQASLFYNNVVRTPTDKGSDITILYARRTFLHLWFQPLDLDLTHFRPCGEVDMEGVEDGMEDVGMGDYLAEDAGEAETTVREGTTVTTAGTTETTAREEERTAGEGTTETTAREGTTETTAGTTETAAREEERTAGEGTTETTAVEKETTAVEKETTARDTTAREEETACMKRPAVKGDGYATFQTITNGRKRMPVSVPENEVVDTAKELVSEGYILTVVETGKIVGYKDCLNALKTANIKAIRAARDDPTPQNFTESMWSEESEL